MLYDEVTEDQYRKVVSRRLGKDDFIEDDGVGGYNDNGMDDWGQGEADMVSDEEIEKKCKSVKAPTAISLISV